MEPRAAYGKQKQTSDRRLIFYKVIIGVHDAPMPKKGTAVTSLTYAVMADSPEDARRGAQNYIYNLQRFSSYAGAKFTIDAVEVLK